MTPGRTIPERLYGVVDAGSASTRYARAGSGNTVVLLLARALDEDALASALFSELSTRFRVIAPELPASLSPACATERRAIASWMRDALDGLGIERANLVMDVELTCSTLDFTIADSARIAAIAILSRELPVPVAVLERCVQKLSRHYPAVLQYRLGPGKDSGVDDAAILHHFLRTT